MDNLTHSLVGLFLARAGFRRASPYGTALMVLAANAPDVDVVSGLGGAVTYIEWHRNITHSLIGWPVVALMSVGLVAAATRTKLPWLKAWLIALVGVGSHLLLDLTNTYGVRLLLPFSGRWFHWDIAPVIDLAIWTILLIGVAAPVLVRLVGSEIGEKDPDSGKAGWAFTALLFLFAYDYGRSVLHDRAVEPVASRTWEDGLTPRRAGAFPSGNPLVWTGVAEMYNAYIVVPVDLRGNFHPSVAETFYKGERTPALYAAKGSLPFRKFDEFVQYPLWMSVPSGEVENATKVTLLDLRFGTPRAIGFAATATVDAQNRVRDTQFGMGGARPR